MNQSLSTGHQASITRYKGACSKHPLHKKSNPNPSENLKYLLLILFVSLSLSLSVPTSLSAQIDHKTIDWQAVDSAFYKQYNPEIPPKWLFPIIFEEGLGMRDTLYLGYHPEAHFGISGENETYGERYVSYDSSYFNAGWGYITDNSSRNTRVASLDPRENIRAGIINFHKAVYPLYMYWDVKRLRSDSLPFEDQSPAPRAEGLLYVDIMQPHNADWCDIHKPALMTDSSLTACYAVDSFLFGNFQWTDYEEVQPFQGFEIRKWQGFYTSLEELDKNEPIKVYPNPASDVLKIENTHLSQGKYRVVSPEGRVLLEGKVFSELIEVDVSDLQEGFYLLILENQIDKIKPTILKFLVSP